MADIPRSRIMAAVHETAEDLHRVGLIDQRTMDQFSENCLAPVKLKSDKILDT